MRIASLDYGESIGFAIADVQKRGKDLYLNHYLLDTLKSPESVINLIKSARCWSAVLELKPSNAPAKSAETYDKLFFGLTTTLDFIKGKDIFSRHQLMLIGPGIWKPLSKSNEDFIGYYKWHPDNNHEKDAMGLLWYAASVCAGEGMKVKYV